MFWGHFFQTFMRAFHWPETFFYFGQLIRIFLSFFLSLCSSPVKSAGIWFDSLHFGHRLFSPFYFHSLSRKRYVQKSWQEMSTSFTFPHSSSHSFFFCLRKIKIPLQNRTESQEKRGEGEKNTTGSQTASSSSYVCLTVTRPLFTYRSL